MKISYLKTLAVLFLLLLNTAHAEESCFYADEKGVFITKKSRNEVPIKFQNIATCSKVSEKKTKQHYKRYETNYNISNNTSGSRLNKSQDSRVRPDEVNLSRVSRERNIRTELGNINLRWDASAESYFGVSLEKTVVSAMNAASRVLAQSSFPPELRSNTYDWRIVIMDSVPTNVDINVNGQNVCHPGWMRFPADIFIAGKRIATECGRNKIPQSEATTQLSETLVHEIGHAIEYKFLGNQYLLHERWHKEGFATWFESLAANYLSGRGVNRGIMRTRVKNSWDENWDPRSFSGSSKDYSRGYAIIATIAEKRSISRLKQVYQFASSKQLPLLEAIKQDLNWDKKALYSSVSHNFDLK